MSWNSVVIRYPKRPPKDVPVYYTTSQLAEMFSVCTQTVRNWADQKLLPGMQIAPRGKRLFSKEAVEQFCEQNPALLAKAKSLI